MSMSFKKDKKIMKEDTKEIEKHADSIIRKSTHMRRNKKLMGLPVPLFAILVVGMVVSGALVTVLLTQYNINLQGAVTLNGAEQVAVLFYDGMPLTTQTTTITAMDYDVLNPGDTYTATHVISNIGANSWIVLFNLSNMPLNYVDPQNVWYGFTFEVREHGTATPIAEIQLGPEEAVEFDYYYNVNALFADPLIDFPFDLRITIIMNPPANIAPEAFDDNLFFAAGSPFDPPVVRSINVLVNDYDITGGPLTIVNVVRTGGDKNFLMTFNTANVYVTTGSETGTTIYEVTISDGELTGTSILLVSVG
jgi:tetrahydromethanopterin S-methyltransferase subunit F